MLRPDLELLLDVSANPCVALEAPRRYLDQIDREREAFEGDYPQHPYVMVGPEGRPLHPDTITARFNRLVDRAGVRRIRLHDVRHTYATLAMDNGQNVKTLSERIGHADTSITLKIYTHPSEVETQRGLADHLGQLIAGLVEASEPPLATDLATIGGLEPSRSADETH